MDKETAIGEAIHRLVEGQLSDDEILAWIWNEAVLSTNKTNVAKPEAVLPLLGEPATTECVHGELLEGLCNACADYYGVNRRLINVAV